ncbi:MAG: pyroglutamyl-peptidase I [Defluviitaleaceae bacterium]|nr:pyroglutamyl-peptidase I [Defluviitaleaceae bacterium]
MKKILFTGFEPFGGEIVNPSREAIMALPTEIDGIKIITAELPAVFGKSTTKLYDLLDNHQPCAVICIGQAAGRTAINIERVAINCDDAPMADNEGNLPTDQKVAKDGPAAYFATLPIKAMVQNMKDAGIPAVISDTAGTYVCNHLMYNALHYATTRGVPMLAGFVHIPYLPEQTVNKPSAPSMPMELVVKGLMSMVRTLGKKPYQKLC